MNIGRRGAHQHLYGAFAAFLRYCHNHQVLLKGVCLNMEGNFKKVHVDAECDMQRLLQAHLELSDVEGDYVAHVDAR